jgi:hypothetical protein
MEMEITFGGGVGTKPSTTFNPGINQGEGGLMSGGSGHE